MSYARFSEDSDVYVYAHYRGWIECCGCSLSEEWAHHSIADVVAHMQEHRAAGHKIREKLLDPATYDEHDFVAMCSFFMCRKDEGHEGEHSPNRWSDRGSNPNFRCPCRLPKEDPIHTPRNSPEGVR